MANHTTGTPHHLRHPTRAGLAAIAATLLAATSVTVLAVTGTATPASAAGLSPFDIPSRGATVPFIEQEAEEAAHNGTKIGPDRRYGTLPSEASGREAVTLDAVGEYVEFTLTAPANAVTFRYSLPDSPAGTGRDAAIDLRANGSLLKSVPVTSKYGWYYGGYPFNNNPGDTNPHHFYDETRAMFGSTQPAGTKIRFQVSSTAQSPIVHHRPGRLRAGRPGDHASPPVCSTWSPTSAPTRPARPTRPRSSRRRSTPARPRAGRSRSRRAPSRSRTTWWSTG